MVDPGPEEDPMLAGSFLGVRVAVISRTRDKLRHCPAAGIVETVHEHIRRETTNRLIPVGDQEQPMLGDQRVEEGRQGDGGIWPLSERRPELLAVFESVGSAPEKTEMRRTSAWNTMARFAPRFVEKQEIDDIRNIW